MTNKELIELLSQLPPEDNICAKVYDSGSNELIDITYDICFAPDDFNRPVLKISEARQCEKLPFMLKRLRDGETIQFGTLYLNECAQSIPLDPRTGYKPGFLYGGDIPAYRLGTNARIGDTDPDSTKQIHWIKWGNKLICDCNLLRGISAKILQEQRLFGQAAKSNWFSIDNVQFRMSSLSSEEWDQAMEQEGVRENLWNCGRIYSWVVSAENIDDAGAEGQAQYGGKSSLGHFRPAAPETQFLDFGFRPVIEIVGL